MPQGLWFKGRYVQPILRGEKQDTVRPTTDLERGDIVGASVGPRAPFAWLEITEVRRGITIDQLDDEHAAAIRETYPRLSRFAQIFFRVHSTQGGNDVYSGRNRPYQGR